MFLKKNKTLKINVEYQFLNVFYKHFEVKHLVDISYNGQNVVVSPRSIITDF